MPTYYTAVADNDVGSGGAAYWNARFASLEAGILAAPGQFAPITSWTTLGVTTASVTISSIPGTYKVLLLRLLLRSSLGAVSDSLLIQPNSDTTAANMYTRRVQFTTAAAFAAQTGSGTGLDLGAILPGASAPASHFAPIDLYIFDYANASNPKQMLWEGYTHTADAAASMMHSVGGCVWKSTAAITSLKFVPSGGNFAAGSGYALYEMN